MNTVRARVSYIGKEAGGELALDVEIPLLDIAPLRIAMTGGPVVRSQVRACGEECKTRHVGSKWSQGPCEGCEVASGWRKDSRIPERTRLCAAEVVWSSQADHRAGRVI